MQKRLTITVEMPPPRLIAEVVSPGKANRDRDYFRKREQYAAIAVPEYWLLDPVAQTVTVLTLEGGCTGKLAYSLGVRRSPLSSLQV